MLVLFVVAAVLSAAIFHDYNLKTTSVFVPTVESSMRVQRKTQTAGGILVSSVSRLMESKNN